MIFQIGDRKIGNEYKPLIVPEIGINAEGSFENAVEMIKDCANSGAEIVKFQCHIPECEMTQDAKKIIPVNASESIYDIMVKCSFSEEEEKELKKITESFGMIYLSTPFSREAVDRLERIGVVAYKIGSGELNNTPLLKYIASKKKPVVLSTGMNDYQNIEAAYDVFSKVPLAILHCVSLYPTKPEQVRLLKIKEMQEMWSDCPIGYSDHTTDICSCFAAVSLGANIIEKHFASNKFIEGPDMMISMDGNDLYTLIRGSNIIYEACKNGKKCLEQELETAKFAFASVCIIADVKKGDKLTKNNLWVKRPGTGILARDYDLVLGQKVNKDIKKDTLITWDDLC